MESLIGIFGTLAGILLGSWLTSGRTQKEKLWDLRRAAYGVILSQIGLINRIYSLGNEIISHTDEHSYFESSARREHEERIAKHWSTARSRFEDDYLVLSDEFIAAFEKIISDREHDNPNEGWDEERERFENSIREAIPLLMAQARHEVADWGNGYGLRGFLRNTFRRFGFGSRG